MTSESIKGIGPAKTQIDGSTLRVAIVHARWNEKVIEGLVKGTITKLKEGGVKDSNIVIESVPGSYELPLACSRCPKSLFYLSSISNLIHTE
jgi:6,7-dimethyl-8-ribityllumazine synthase